MIAELALKEDQKKVLKRVDWKGLEIIDDEMRLA